MNLNRVLFLNRFLGISLLVLATGCAPDRTVDDFRRERLNEELTKMSAYAGVYQGKIQQGDTEVGTLIFEVDPTTRVQAGGDSPIAQEQALIRGLVYFKTGDSSVDQDLAMLSYRDGYLDSSTGQFAIELSTTALPDNRIRMTGKFADGKAQGTLLSTYDGSRYTFGLSHDGAVEVRDSLLAPRPSDNARLRPHVVETYSGGRESMGLQDKVTMTVQSDDLNPEQRFINRLTHLHLVDVSLTFQPDINVVFTQAVLDTRTGLLRGKFEISTATLQSIINLRCVKTENVYACDYIINNTGTSQAFRVSRI